MCKALIIGAGGVGTVVTQKIAANPVFTDVMLASRTKSKCDAVAAAIGGNRVKTAEVDADSVPQLCELFRAFKPDIVVNVALPYQDLTIMDACLECGCNYLDTANYEPKDEAHFEYSWQWAYQDRFKAAGLTAILGCGFDPGVTAIFTAYAAKHHFDEIHYLDIVDCNAGNHGMAFATNFNPEINIREVTQKGRYYENGEWVVTEPHEIHKPLSYPGIGERESYVIYHEELESLVKNYPTIRRARFWMTFGQEYLTHLRVIQNIGMARIDPIIYNGVEIVPIQFLKAVLPDPKSLGANYHGQTSIGCRIKGLKDGKERTYYIYNNCDHEQAFKETGTQAVSFTTAGCTGEDILQLMTTIDRRFMAGLAYFMGARELGCGVIRVGNGIPELQWDTIRRIGPTGCIVVPSFLIKLVGYAQEHGIDYRRSSLRRAICIGEALRDTDFSNNTLGATITELWPELELFSTYASTEMQTSITECGHHCGGHVPADMLLVELLDEQNNPVPEGQEGEVVITTLGVRGMPLLRFRTGDICIGYTERCACGRSTMRLSSVIGRKGQMIKFKGTTLYPPALYDVLENIPGVNNYIIEVFTGSLGTDQIVLRIGSARRDEAFEKEIKDTFRSKVRVAPEVVFEPVEYIAKKQMPQMSRKQIKFVDLREQTK